MKDSGPVSLGRAIAPVSFPGPYWPVLIGREMHLVSYKEGYIINTPWKPNNIYYTNIPLGFQDIKERKR